MARQIINLGAVAGDGTGDPIRTGGDKINDNFLELYEATGGAQYIDSAYTVGSPLSIPTGTPTAITNNANTVIDGNEPIDFTNGLWFNDKLQGVNDKDRFVTEVRFKAKTTVNNDFFDVSIDIGGGVGVIRKESFNFTRSANTEQSFARPFHYFTGSTFIANGGELVVSANSGTLSIYDIEIVPTRIHKGY